MSSFLELAASRRSIRKYESRDIHVEDIEYLIKAAVSAPSGCNSQCWKFVCIKDQNIKNRIADKVMESIEEELSHKKDELPEQYLDSKRKMATFFVNAPVAIAVFMTHLEFYDPVFTNALKDKGFSHEDIMKLFAHADVLSVGAAIQNLLLAVQEKGYGACWMNEPAIAGGKINEILGIPDEHKFISLIPVGYPAYTPREKKMKDISEVFSIV
ncbi:MAG: nitroreductase family protein [Bacillota bacterium]|nr:nitroreductase family protein [Bacillota bacterium]